MTGAWNPIQAEVYYEWELKNMKRTSSSTSFGFNGINISNENINAGGREGRFIGIVTYKDTRNGAVYQSEYWYYSEYSGYIVTPEADVLYEIIKVTIYQIAGNIFRIRGIPTS